ncbi:MAG: hypothetical protein LLF99_00785 [Desulfobacteraceae bacterium]|nr:hypothetical protein [Desulfobacteraceae bacterium]
MASIASSDVAFDQPVGTSFYSLAKSNLTLSPGDTGPPGEANLPEFPFGNVGSNAGNRCCGKGKALPGGAAYTLDALLQEKNEREKGRGAFGTQNAHKMDWFAGKCRETQKRESGLKAHFPVYFLVGRRRLELRTS